MAGIEVLAFYSGVRKRDGIGLVANNLVIRQTMLRTQLLMNNPRNASCDDARAIYTMALQEKSCINKKAF